MMTSLQWYVLAVGLVGTLALLAIAAPGRWQSKSAALLCTALFLPLAYASIDDLLSRPKPMPIAAAKQQLNNAVVTASAMRENEAIYLWVQLPGVSEPRSYQLPWDEKMAIELHKAEREAEVEGTEVQMQVPKGDTFDNEEPMFQAAKYEPPPPKES